MEFIDHTGHIFSLPTYNSEPIGYEYDEQPYIFWIDSEYTNKLSVNNFYIKPIRFLIDKENHNEIENIKITCNSNIYSIIGSKRIQDALSNNENILNSINIREDELSSSLNSNDLILLNVIGEDNKEYTIVTFYVIGSSVNTGSYISNILIECDFSNNDVTNKSGSKFYKTDLNYTFEIISPYIYKYLEANNVYETISDALGAAQKYIDKSTSEKIKFIVNIYQSKENIINGHNYATYILESNNNDLLEDIQYEITNEDIKEHEDNIDNVSNSLSEYTFISVGGVFDNLSEELVINGKNIGLNLPKDICKAIYQCGFYNNEFNEQLYNEKIKEYLINFMEIKNECGNYNSAIKSLNWFGYGDKIKLYKLLKTDNEFLSQYIRDNFDIKNDIIESFKSFRNTTFISLVLNGNNELEKTFKQNFDSDFWGEGKPDFENLFEKIIEKEYDNTGIKFWRSYFDFVFNELGLKLMALKYYYEKYFLPVHIKIHSISISESVFINDNKLIIGSTNKIIEQPLLIQNNSTSVVFPISNNIYLYKQLHYFDENYNEFTNSYDIATETNDDIYYIEDTCISIPIKFYKNNNQEGFYDCTMILTKDDKIIYEKSFSFYQSETKKYENFIISPRLYNKNYDLNYWLKSYYSILLNVNGKWFKYDFNIKIPDIDLSFYKLQYKYYLDDDSYNNMFRQLNNPSIINIDDHQLIQSINFNSFMWEPQLVQVNNNVFYKLLSSIKDNSNSLIYTDDDCYNGYEKGLITYIRINGQLIIIKSKLKKNFLMYIPYELLKPNSILIYDEYFTYNPYILLSEEETNLVVDEDDTKWDDLFTFLLEDDVNSKTVLRLIYQEGYFYPYMRNEQQVTDVKFKVYQSFNHDVNWIVNKYYTEKRNIVTNRKFLNKIHLFDIYLNGEKIPYKENEDYTELYNEFFNEFGKNNVNLNNNDKYDFYLMHDLDYWYGIFISKDTVNMILDDPKPTTFVYKNTYFKKVTDKNEIGDYVLNGLYKGDGYVPKNDYIAFNLWGKEYTLENYCYSDDEWKLFKNNIYTYNKVGDEYVKVSEYETRNGLLGEYTKLDNNYQKRSLYEYDDEWYMQHYNSIQTYNKVETKKYVFKYINSDEKFLINRMELIDMKGIYHFDKEDLIVASLHNDRLGTNITLGTKWTISPILKTTNKYYESKSNTEITLIDLKEYSQTFDKGFYDVKVEYSLDDNIQHKFEKRARLRIG